MKKSVKRSISIFLLSMMLLANMSLAVNAYEGQTVFTNQEILKTLEFYSNNDVHKPIIEALEIIKQNPGSGFRYFSLFDNIPTEGVIRPKWRKFIIEKDEHGQERINRINYEICVLQALRDKLRCKEIWVKGAYKYRNPDEDLPVDFEKNRMESIWGDGTTTYALDSKKFGSRDQNLLTEWHIRYSGRGVMIYWHVEKNSTCIYSQLKSRSSSSHLGIYIYLH